MAEARSEVAALPPLEGPLEKSAILSGFGALEWLEVDVVRVRVCLGCGSEWMSFGQVSGFWALGGRWRGRVKVQWGMTFLGDVVDCVS